MGCVSHANRRFTSYRSRTLVCSMKTSQGTPTAERHTSAKAECKNRSCNFAPCLEVSRARASGTPWRVPHWDVVCSVYWPSGSMTILGERSLVQYACTWIRIPLPCIHDHTPMYHLATAAYIHVDSSGMLKTCICSIWFWGSDWVTISSCACPIFRDSY